MEWLGWRRDSRAGMKASQRREASNEFQWVEMKRVMDEIMSMEVRGRRWRAMERPKPRNCCCWGYSIGEGELGPRTAGGEVGEFLGERAAMDGGEGPGSIMVSVGYELEDISRELFLQEVRMYSWMLEGRQIGTYKNINISKFWSLKMFIILVSNDESCSSLNK